MIKIFVNIKLWLEKKRYKRYIKKNPLFYSFISYPKEFPPLPGYREFLANYNKIAEEYNLDEKRLYFADKTARL